MTRAPGANPAVDPRVVAALLADARRAESLARSLTAAAERDRATGARIAELIGGSATAADTAARAQVVAYVASLRRAAAQLHELARRLERSAVLAQAKARG